MIRKDKATTIKKETVSMEMLNMLKAKNRKVMEMRAKKATKRKRAKTNKTCRITAMSSSSKIMVMSNKIMVMKMDNNRKNTD